MLLFYLSCTSLNMVEKRLNMNGGLLYDCMLLYLIVIQLLE